MEKVLVNDLFYIAKDINKIVLNGILFLVRPHDRVPVKEMKADWHACLDNKIGFKVMFLNELSFILKAKLI